MIAMPLMIGLADMVRLRSQHGDAFGARADRGLYLANTAFLGRLN